MWGWIVLGVVLLLITAILAIRVTFIVSYDRKWITKIRILFIEKEINVTQLLRGILFPNQVVEEKKEAKNAPPETEKSPPQQKKDPMAPLKEIYSKDGVAGIIELVQTVIDTLNRAVGVFFRHFIIDELDVKIIVASGDAALTGREYGRVCGAYYPFIGFLRNGMKVRRYSEEIRADFLAPKGEESLFFRGSISVMNLLGIVLTAVKTFLVNLIKSKRTGNPVPQQAAKNNE